MFLEGTMDSIIIIIIIIIISTCFDYFNVTVIRLLQNYNTEIVYMKNLTLLNG